MNISSKVICVNADFSRVMPELLEQSNGYPLSFPVRNEEYIIREIFDNDGIVPSVLLEGIYNPSFTIPALGGIRRELAFEISRFREIQEEDLVLEDESIIKEEVLI